VLPGDAVAPAARQFRAEDQVDAAAPEDAADRADRVAQFDLAVRMDPAAVVRAGIRFRRSSQRVLLAVKLRRFGRADGRRRGSTTEVTERTTEVTENIKALGRVLRSVSVSSVVELFRLLDLAERIVKRAAHRPHLVERAAAACAVGQQNEVAVARWIDPQRRAGKAHVAEGRRRHARAAR